MTNGALMIFSSKRDIDRFDSINIHIMQPKLPIKIVPKIISLRVL
jgi:hypothetical protein